MKLLLLIVLLAVWGEVFYLVGKSSAPNPNSWTWQESDTVFYEISDKPGYTMRKFESETPFKVTECEMSSSTACY